MAKNQLDSNTQKELEYFLYSTMANIAKYHSMNPEIFLKTKISFHFVDGEHYGKEIHKIDPNAKYTDDGRYKGIGKTIRKNDNVFIVINAQILTALIQSEYKNSISKHAIYHEIGHCINYIINPNLCPKEKFPGLHPLFDVSKYLFSIAIDEYMANNYIMFLLTKEECAKILAGNTLYTDIENLYSDIRDPFDLFNRFWNGPNAIYINLIKYIPLFQKTGGFKETKELGSMNIKEVIANLNKPEQQFDIIYNRLVALFNTIVADYNSDNPLVLQKEIKKEQKCRAQRETARSYPPVP
jgi:hypothetical protein